MTLKIRDAEPGDEVAWRRLWSGYLAFCRVDLPADITSHTWARIFDTASRLSMRVAVVDDELAGFAIHHFHESSWVKTPDCYLEDLYVDDRFRGQGLGRALLDDLIKRSKKNGWSRLHWHTESDNHRAQKLYNTYVPDNGQLHYRLKLG
jgi:Acetyltransferases